MRRRIASAPCLLAPRTGSKDRPSSPEYSYRDDKMEHIFKILKCCAIVSGRTSCPADTESRVTRVGARLVTPKSPLRGIALAKNCFRNFGSGSLGLRKAIGAADGP